jgi:asparagine synthase (glutamine-hydrolysing)
VCGIAGHLRRRDAADPAITEAQLRLLDHRGPDSWGVFSDGRAAIGQTRLAIIDLVTGDPPIVVADGTIGAAFNGEIYNFRELRSELERDGQTFQSTGDTAVLLRALSLHGHAACAKLRGMFAFGRWDPKSRRLMLARDPLGIKPLYVCRNPDPNGRWSVLFASEVRAILASGLLDKPKLDPAAVASVVWNGYVMGPGTAIKGIETLWPGEARVLDARGQTVASDRFWNMPDGDAPKDLGESDLRDALRESVRLHMVSDVPLGVFLSGGIDSSAVANLAQKSSDRPINTFTLAFEEQSYNEGHHARKIAEAIGSQHREVTLTEPTFVGAIETALNTLDQPTFDGLNSYYMSKAVREAGLTVALVGTGGDELFGGYTSFRFLPRLQRMANRTRWLPRGAKVAAARAIASVAHGKAGAVAPQTRWAKLPYMVESADDELALYQLAYALFLPDFHRELLDRGAISLNGCMTSGLPRAMREQLERETDGRSPLSAISVMELRCFLGERLLRDSDAASMAVSLELRLPLVDQVLVERVSRVNDDERYQPLGRKSMLRRIGLEGLDPQIFERPKSGFVLPFDTWIRKGLGQAMDDTMSDARMAKAVGLNPDAVTRLWQAYQDGAPGMYWSRVWAIYVLIRWCHHNGVLL